MNAAVIYHTPSRLCEELASPFATAEAAIRRASANVGIGLLRILGASETGRVVECVDRVRDRLSLQRQANPNEIQMTAIHEAHWWVQEHYQVRIVSPLEREKLLFLRIY